MNTSATSSVAAPSTVTNPNGQLKSEDFINLLITQLQNQDPLEPMKNESLLQQVSQIGSLQSQTTLTNSISEMVLQNQISAASGMIGKFVVGADGNGAELKGVVTSIKVVDKSVTLELDSGKQLELSRVTGVTNLTGTTAATTTSSGTNTSGTNSSLTT